VANFVTVATVGDVPQGEARVFEVDGRSIAVCQVSGEDCPVAIENRCSHDDGPLGEGTLRGASIECPRHGALFDIHSGAAKSLPAVRGVQTYAVRVEGNEIQVALD
jgi:3-phenylpropionate/trans-cinnamate dioxygenase ferredoxin subunit